MTRTKDVYDTVNEKAKKANSSKADLFLSIHCNSAASASANGTEALIYGHDGESDILATNISNYISDKLELRNRGVKVRKDLVVLNSTSMPAVLVETAFISNEYDRNKLLNNQKDFAEAIAKGIFEYLGIRSDEMAEESKIIVDGKEINVNRILKDGSNYVKIRDLAAALGYDVSNNGSVAILTKR